MDKIPTFKELKVHEKQTQQLQRIGAIGLIESWFCNWDDLLRLFAIARVEDPKIGLDIVQNPLLYQNVMLNCSVNE